VTRLWSGVRRQLLLLASILLLSPAAAHAAPQWLSPVTVSTTGVQQLPNPRVALDPQGNAIAVWADNGIRWAIRPPGTDVFSPEESVAGTGRDPAVAFDLQGNAVAVWADEDGSGIRWAARAAGEVAFGAEGTISETGQSPDVAFDPQGNAIAVWADNGIQWAMRPVGNGFVVSGGAISATGQDPALSIDPLGNAIVVWAESGSGIKWAARPAGLDTAFGAALTVASGGEKPDVGLDPQGTAIAVWREGGIRWAARAAGSDAFGASSSIAETGRDPRIAFDSLGNGIVVWATDAGIRWAARAGPTLVPVGPVSGGGEHPDVALDPQGNGIAVWAVFNVTSFSIRAARYDPIGSSEPPPPADSGSSRDSSSSDRSSRRSSSRSSSDDSRSRDREITARAARNMKLSAKRRVRLGRRVRLRGSLDSDRKRCKVLQKVALQRRRPGSKRFQTFDVAITGRDGEFVARTKPRRTYLYRARVSRTDNCELGLSSEKKVRVLPQRKRSRRARRTRGRSVRASIGVGPSASRRSGTLGSPLLSGVYR